MTISPEPPTPSETPSAQTESPEDPHSSFRLEISVAIGYQRRRATLGGAFEGHVVTLGLLIGGVAIAAIIIWEILKLLANL
jgi:hypothetical protein